MTTLHQKFQIMESLDFLDQAQAKEVLNYIQDLQKRSTIENQRHQNVKREAMIEIRQALTKGRTLSPLF
jgi:hypothetical protein